MSESEPPHSAPAVQTPDVVRALIEQLPDVVLVHRMGTVLYVNHACVEVLGYPSVEHFVGRSMLEFVHPDDRAETVRRVQHMNRTGQSLPQREMRVLHEDGSLVWFELAPVRFVELPDGPASLVVARDRTQQRKLQDRLMAADQIASLGSLASGLVHEVSNPLTYVMGNLAVLSEGLNSLEQSTKAEVEINELRKALADARQGAERVRDLLADMKVFSRPDLGRRSRLELRKVLDSAINMAWPQIRPRARLVRDYGAAPAVRGVESKVALALFHLLINAAQAIDPGSADGHKVEVSLGEDADGWAYIEIRDTGCGLSEATRDQMWEPFFTTRSRGEGAGLGLPVVRSVIVAMGGEVEVVPREGQGAVARLRLPATARSTTPAPSSEWQAVPAEERFGRVLVVDDEPVIGALVRRALVGHDVYIINSGRDAIELAQELEFDALICDLVMPDVSGVQVYEQLQALRPAMVPRIIFLTAGAFSAADRAFLDHIDNQVLDKPFEFSDLRQAVQLVLRSSG